MNIFLKIRKIPNGVKAAFVFTLATVFSRGLAIITTPVFTRIMSTEQIGVVSLYNSWYALISSIATLSLTSGGFAVAMKEYADQRDQYQSSILTLTTSVSMIICLVYFSIPAFWNRLFGLPSSLMCLMLIGFVVAPARDIWLARQRYEHKYKLAGTVMMVSALLASVLSVVLVLQTTENNATAQVRLFSNYAVIYGVAGCIWILLIIRGKTFYHKSYWKESLKISIPLVGYSIAAQILNVSDRMMIDRMIGKSAVGIYSTLYTVSSLSLLVWQAINNSFVPYLFQNIERKERRKDIRKTSLMLIAGYSGVAIVLTYFAPQIVHILATDEYYEAIYIMPPIAAGIFFTSLANLYSNIAVYHKKARLVFYPAAIAALVNIILNCLFIPVYGYMAAAYTTFVSYALLAFLQAVWANRVHAKMESDNQTVYSDKGFLLLSIITTMLTMLGLVLYQYNVLRYLFVFVMLIGLGVCVLAVLKNKKHK